MARWTKATDVVSRRIVMSVVGRDKVGKSSTALTAPAPLLFLDFNSGLEGVVGKYIDKKTIYHEQYGHDINIQASCVKAWNQYKSDWKDALTDSEIKTIVLDTATEALVTFKVASWGRVNQPPEVSYKYGEINRPWSEMIQQIYDTDKNLVLIHEMRKVYVNNDWDGKTWERDGYNKTGHLVQVEVENTKNFDEDGFQDVTHRITICRFNVSLEGTTIPFLLDGETGERIYGGFPSIAVAVIGGEEEEWE